MAYQAIYRKFRPKTFDEVLGQEHITTILKNQLKNDNIAHAYLFSGTRGTGKTSTAKIFARAVNCTDNIDGNPCNNCEVCNGILEENIMDVVEMDAASNNSVDDIRELREKVKYLPAKGRYKVYIIDEVHMLSKGAFNALLKTLEEPPKHLLFILATTEPQRLPATILSRCQRFDFKRLTVDTLKTNMQNICEEIGVNIEDKAMSLIARNADGAMRDALSILDQCISFVDTSEGANTITYDYVTSVLGTVNNDTLFQMSDYIISKNLDEGLKLIDYIMRQGRDIKQFVKELIIHFRNIMIIKTTEDVYDIIDGTEEMINMLKEQSQTIQLSEVIRILNILSDIENKTKWASHPRIYLETGLVKIITPQNDYTIEALAQRISTLEKMIGENDFSKQNISKPKEDKKPDPIKAMDTKKEEIPKKVKDEDKDIELDNGDKRDTRVSEDEKVQNSISEVNGEGIINMWPQILKQVKKKRITTHALLMEGKPAYVEGNVLTVAFDEQFGIHKEAINKKEHRTFIEDVVKQFVGADIKINFVMAYEVSTKDPKTGTEDDVEKMINKAKDIFGEDIVKIEE
ncbi:DNA polymerase III subunit gamma/tau [Clostridiisalibacter paucivorans]|uniref:DNA polymerase III subunit gamma/tau n=1 Tax=Clostridiisalibacter paucivorans TaxID=408753 RepID=UPI00047E946F|nr:DNA polymerase III subunit gamma/tau [Clostridiisalibacter paucivorans]